MTTKERKTGQKVQYDILRCHRKKRKDSKTNEVIQKDAGTTVKRIQWLILLQIIRLWLIITHRVGKSSCIWSSRHYKTKGERPSSYLNLTPSVLVPMTASRWSVSLLLSHWLFAVNRLFFPLWKQCKSMDKHLGGRCLRWQGRHYSSPTQDCLRL